MKTSFTARMIDKAKAVEIQKVKATDRIICHIEFPESFFEVILRIARATDLKPSRVLREYIESHESELLRIANATEKVAPKSRLSEPLRPRKKPSMKSIKEFVEKKKRNSKDSK